MFQIGHSGFLRDVSVLPVYTWAMLIKQGNEFDRLSQKTKNLFSHRSKHFHDFWPIILQRVFAYIGFTAAQNNLLKLWPLPEFQSCSVTYTCCASDKYTCFFKTSTNFFIKNLWFFTNPCSNWFIPKNDFRLGSSRVLRTLYSNLLVQLEKDENSVF